MTPQEQQNATKYLEKSMDRIERFMEKEFKEVKDYTRALSHRKVDKTLFKWVIGGIVTIMTITISAGMSWMLNTTEKITQVNYTAENLIY